MTWSPPIPTPLFSEALSQESSQEENERRVPVTIRYSAESGLKPYYLTVAKRVQDQHPDVLLERIEVSSGTEGGGAEAVEGEINQGTFEVLVDGKIVVRTNQRSYIGSIFVSMTEMDLAIARARKRRRPSTVYGESGILNGKESSNSSSISFVEKDMKSRLEGLTPKAATELQQEINAGWSNTYDGTE